MRYTYKKDMEKAVKVRVLKFKNQIITARGNLSISFNGVGPEEIYESDNITEDELVKIKKTKKIPSKLTKVPLNTKIKLPQ